MSNVISLAQKRVEQEPHNSGDAHCVQCGHKWIAVAAIGVIELECPACHTFKGLFTYPCEPTSAWVCGCGCHVFMLSGTSHEMICWNCGEYQRFDNG